jgi:hypothetical protein
MMGVAERLRGHAEAFYDDGGTPTLPIPLIDPFLPSFETPATHKVIKEDAETAGTFREVTIGSNMNEVCRA